MTARTRALCVFASIAAIAWAAPAGAGPIVSWGGDYVSADVVTGRPRVGGNFYFDTDDSTTDGVRDSYRYSRTTALSPAVGDDYAGTSATFYGGLGDARESGANYFGVTQQLTVRENGEADYLELGSTRNEGGNHFHAAYLIWDKADFLGGSDASTVGFSPGDAEHLARFTLAIRDVEKAGYHTLRWLVESGGALYVSDDVTGADPLSDNTTYETTDFSAMMWMAVAPQENSLNAMYPNTGSLDVATASLGNVTAVGFMVQGYGTSGSATDRALQHYQVSSFEVVAAPELATLALLAAGTALALARRRRH